MRPPVTYQVGQPPPSVLPYQPVCGRISAAVAAVGGVILVLALIATGSTLAGRLWLSIDDSYFLYFLTWFPLLFWVTLMQFQLAVVRSGLNFRPRGGVYTLGLVSTRLRLSFAAISVFGIGILVSGIAGATAPPINDRANHQYILMVHGVTSIISRAEYVRLCGQDGRALLGPTLAVLAWVVPLALNHARFATNARRDRFIRDHR